MWIKRLSSPRMLELPWRNPSFGLYSAGSAISLIGMWMQRIAVGWLAWQLTGSGFWLGVVAFADFFPTVLIGPIAGTAADRWDRLTIVKICQAISLLQATTLCWLTATGQMTIEVLVALTSAQGTVVAFYQPARLALVPSLVPQADLATAVALNSVVFNLARFIGPACAGAVIVWSGIWAAFAANAVSYVPFLAALFYIRVNSDHVPAKARNMLTELREGIGYTVSHPAIAALLVLLIATGVGGRPLSELLPGIAADLFHAGAGGLSLLASSMGGGAILGGLWLGERAHAADLTRMAAASSILAALATVVAIATDTLWLAMPAVAVIGFATSIAGIAIQTSIQLATSGPLRGRVMGLYGLIFRGAPAIGALSAGAASAVFGLRIPIIFGALLMAAVSARIYFGRERIAATLERDVEAESGWSKENGSSERSEESQLNGES
jgi:predicted MFS family arabinose efflux permease